jgi:hypothetical protein
VSNIVEFKRGSSQRDIAIVIKANNCAVKSCCSICGICDREQTPFDAYLDEPGYHWVCGQCLEQHEFKGYAQCLDILNSAAYLVLRDEYAAKQREALSKVNKILGEALGFSDNTASIDTSDDDTSDCPF